MSGPREATSDDARTVESDTRLSRRSVLGTVGVAAGAAVAGCSTEGERRAQTTPLVDETARVEPGRYEVFEFELDDARWTTVSATLSDRSVDAKQDGPAVDVLVMTAAQHREFQDEGRIEYVGGVSMPDVVDGEVSGSLEPGSYVVLVDNSARGPASPGNAGSPGVVDVEITAGDSRP
jgi:hypothetical protein